VHYFIHADKALVTETYSADEIIQYVYLGPDVQEVMLQFYTANGDGEHRVFWGANLIQTTGTLGNQSLTRMGDLPAAGGWVRLKIPAKILGVEGMPIKGIAYHMYGGSPRAIVYWDKTTTSSAAQDFLASAEPVPVNMVDDFTTWTVRFTLSRDDSVTLYVMDEDNHVVNRIASGWFPAEPPAGGGVGREEPRGRLRAQRHLPFPVRHEWWIADGLRYARAGPHRRLRATAEDGSGCSADGRDPGSLTG
jgi:hypothetical protein